ncbi:MAG: sigma factor-like helix-turn-helix DNA-binding protein [bacterium]|nr:sigma factor-like helix-turn-helix DNA-binding protein [bacterium]
MSAKLSFNPKQVVKRLLQALPPRARDVIINRYGLGKMPQRMTLEAIGKTYKITRERVRQIENYSFGVIRKSDIYKKEQAANDELMKYINSLGGVVHEEHFLKKVADDKSVQNHIHFMLVLGDEFKKRKEDEDFHHRWFINEAIAQKVESSLKKLYESLSSDSLIPEAEMVASFLDHLKEISEEYKNDEILRRWLYLSKKISRNPLGEWGLSSSPNIKAKGMRDFAYLAIRRHGSPMHFTEVAKAIQQLFDREAHVATCHNELIKDKRFVLVGRGLYALSEWGYASGVVRDVIRELIKKNGPLSKQEIIDKVLKERYVKENTIAVNLQNSRFFKKNKDGKYAVI